MAKRVFCWLSWSRPELREPATRFENKNDHQRLAEPTRILTPLRHRPRPGRAVWAAASQPRQRPAVCRVNSLLPWQDPKDDLIDALHQGNQREVFWTTAKGDVGIGHQRAQSSRRRQSQHAITQAVTAQEEEAWFIHVTPLHNQIGKGEGVLWMPAKAGAPSECIHERIFCECESWQGAMRIETFREFINGGQLVGVAGRRASLATCGRSSVYHQLPAILPDPQRRSLGHRVLRRCLFRRQYHRRASTPSPCCWPLAQIRCRPSTSRRVIGRLTVGSSGSSVPKADRVTQSEIRRRMEELGERMQRNGIDHPDYDRWEAELGRLLAYAQNTQGFARSATKPPPCSRPGRGQCHQGRDQSDQSTGAPGEAMGEHLRDNIQSPTGQRPVYCPRTEGAAWLIETG